MNTTPEDLSSYESKVNFLQQIRGEILAKNPDAFGKKNELEVADFDVSARGKYVEVYTTGTL